MDVVYFLYDACRDMTTRIDNTSLAQRRGKHMEDFSGQNITKKSLNQATSSDSSGSSERKDTSAASILRPGVVLEGWEVMQNGSWLNHVVWRSDDCLHVFELRRENAAVGVSGGVIQV
jgi:hypothetical protein